MENNKRKIIITGTSRGIGLELSKYFLSCGYIVIGCSRGAPTFEHNSYYHYTLDISDETQLCDWIHTVEQEIGNIEIAINNAAIYKGSYAILTSAKQANEMMQTNFIGSFLFVREIAKHMMKHNYGRIINISSIATMLCDSGTSIYSATKSATIAFFNVIAKEVSSFNITCNSIAVSYFESEMTEALPESTYKSLMHHLVIKRAASIQDIINAILFFSAKESAYITGQTLNLGFIG
jgi:3-oxoacyl-[acyl-carrier protein] reductase